MFNKMFNKATANQENQDMAVQAMSQVKAQENLYLSFLEASLRSRKEMLAEARRNGEPAEYIERIERAYHASHDLLRVIRDMKSPEYLSEAKILWQLDYEIYKLKEKGAISNVLIDEWAKKEFKIKIEIVKEQRDKKGLFA